MRIATVLGTRPEIIRLSQIIGKLDRVAEHLLIHTGQNHSASLSDVFFAELGIRAPDRHLGVSEPDFARQIGRIMAACHDAFAELRPDRLLVLGDTNSALCSVVAKRVGIPVFHMEAGNRCFDPRVPEEVNRKIVDHCSDVLMPYTERSRQNLLREGFAPDRIYAIGNPIYEIMQTHDEAVQHSGILRELGLERQGYFLVTLHRAENVDLSHRLEAFVAAFAELAREHARPVIVSTHPRTRQRMRQAGIAGRGELRFMEPFGFPDFLALERSAYCVLSDSGTVQEECAIMRVPNVTLRDVTERPETIESGSNILSGAELPRILSAVRVALLGSSRWQPPPEYLAPAVSDTVLRLVMGHMEGLPVPRWDA